MHSNFFLLGPTNTFLKDIHQQFLYKILALCGGHLFFLSTCLPLPLFHLTELSHEKPILCDLDDTDLIYTHTHTHTHKHTHTHTHTKARMTNPKTLSLPLKRMINSRLGT